MALRRMKTIAMMQATSTAKPEPAALPAMTAVVAAPSDAVAEDAPVTGRTGPGELLPLPTLTTTGRAEADTVLLIDGVQVPLWKVCVAVALELGLLGLLAAEDAEPEPAKGNGGEGVPLAGST